MDAGPVLWVLSQSLELESVRRGRAKPMSGVMKRMGMIFRAKANKALDRAEDPRETLDYSYQKQLELLQKVRRGVADVATSRKRLELQLNQLQSQSSKLEDQGRKALALGREDLAREALSRRAALQQQVTDLETQHATLQGEEEKLTLAAQRLQAKVDAFRTKKETIKATYTAAQAQTRIGEAFSGISEEMGDVGLAIQRAEDKTAQLQARAGAIDELLASGALDDQSGMHKDDIQAELDRLSGGTDVELELQRMKAELAGAPPATGRPSRAARTRRSRRPGSSRRTPRASTSSSPRRGGRHDRTDHGEGQLTLEESRLPELNKLDEELLAEMENGDGPGFRATLQALLDKVHELGEPLPDDSLEPSDLILPAPGATLEEVRDLLTDDGLIPGT